MICVINVIRERQLFCCFVNVFVGDGVLDVPKSPEIYCISFYVILFVNVNCSAPRYAKGQPHGGGENDKTGGASPLTITLRS